MHFMERYGGFNKIDEMKIITKHTQNATLPLLGSRKRRAHNIAVCLLKQFSYTHYRLWRNLRYIHLN